MNKGNTIGFEYTCPVCDHKQTYFYEHNGQYPGDDEIDAWIRDAERQYTKHYEDCLKTIKRQ